MIWLGFIWNWMDGSLAAAPHWIEKVLTTYQGLLSIDSCLVRNFAGFVEMIISLFPVVGNCSRVASKWSQICVANANSWDIFVQIPLEVK